MSTEEATLYERCSRKVRVSGSQGLALFCGLLGLLCLIFIWPLGLVLILVAFFADAKYKQTHYCGSCGNDVASTSILCPTCKAGLVAPRLSTQVARSARQVAITLLTLLILAIIVVLLVSNR